MQKESWIILASDTVQNIFWVTPRCVNDFFCLWTICQISKINVQSQEIFFAAENFFLKNKFCIIVAFVQNFCEKIMCEEKFGRRKQQKIFLQLERFENDLWLGQMKTCSPGLISNKIIFCVKKSCVKIAFREKKTIEKFLLVKNLRMIWDRAKWRYVHQARSQIKWKICVKKSYVKKLLGEENNWNIFASKKIWD